MMRRTEREFPPCAAHHWECEVGTLRCAAGLEAAGWHVAHACTHFTVMQFLMFAACSKVLRHTNYLRLINAGPLVDTFATSTHVCWGLPMPLTLALLV